jgi:hypothetical protein
MLFARSDVGSSFAGEIVWPLVERLKHILADKAYEASVVNAAKKKPPYPVLIAWVANFANIFSAKIGEGMWL